MFAPPRPIFVAIAQQVQRLLTVAAVSTAALMPPAHAAGVQGQGTWENTLKGRDLDGDLSNGPEAFFDTVLNVTWLADANYAKTTGYTSTSNGIGWMLWNGANAWADNLVVGAYSDWRLPTMVDTATTGCNKSNAGGTDCGFNVLTKDAVTGTVYSEIAHLYYVTLGNKAYCTPGDARCFDTQLGWGLQNKGPFINVENYGYWSDVEHTPNTRGAWYFNNYYGEQNVTDKETLLNAWAVRSGDVGVAAATPVPEPQTYALAWLYAVLCGT